MSLTRAAAAAALRSQAHPETGGTGDAELTAPTDIIAAMTSPHWWGPWFSRGDWTRWHIFLRALFGLPIPSADLPLYTQCTGRIDPPTTRAQEADAIVGRRGGKTRIMATVAAYLAAFDTDWRQYLDPGEQAHILLVAKDMTQAGVAFGYLSSLFLDHPILRQLVTNASSDTITLRNRVTIRVAAASFRGLRGYAVAALLADEISFWFDGEISANPAEEIIAAIRPAMLQFQGRGMLLCASSPYRRTGPLWNAFRNHYGHPSRTLVWRAPTTTMNPLAPAAEISRAYVEDPQRASAEYGAEFRADLAAFVDREVVEAAVVLGQRELPPSPAITYAAFVDPSGGANDSFTLAIAHNEDGRGILDVVREVVPPFSPESVTEEFSQTLRQYRITRVVGDRYGGQFPVELFAKRGVAYEPSERSKSDLYREWLPLANSGKIELLDNRRLVAQWCSLERRVARGGRDSVDHPPGAHDDLCNAASGALVLVAGDVSAPALWRPSAFGPAATISDRTYLIYAVIASDDMGALAAIYWAKTSERYWAIGAPPLLVLDISVATLSDLTPFAAQVNDRINQFLDEARGPRPACAIMAPETLLRHGHGWEPLPPVLSASALDLPTLALRAAVFLSQGQVKLTPTATELIRRHPFSAIANWRTGDVSSPVSQAFIAGILLGLADPADLAPPAAA